MRTKNLIIALVIVSFLFPTTLGQKQQQYVYNLSYRFENSGSIPIELLPSDASIPLFMNTTWQNVRLEEVDEEYSVKIIDVDNNKGAVVAVDRVLPPSQEISFSAIYKIISMEREVPSFDLEEAESFDSIPQNLIDEYCISTETFPIDNQIFFNVTSNIVSEEDSVLEAVTKIVEYITNNISYHNFEVPQYPNKTLEDRIGDCDDQSILLITMCRNLNIPAYLQVGIYIHPIIDDHDTSWDDHLVNNADGVGWHGWAHVYIPPWGWVPVDLTLTSAKSGIEVLKSAPEYGSNIIPALNVSKQPYIGETIATRDRIIQSTLYVTVSDEAHILHRADNPFQNYLLLGLGAALLIAIFFMFRLSSR